MISLSTEVLEQIRDALKRPEGTVAFTYLFDKDLFDIKNKGGKLFEVISGKHYFLVERTDNFEIKFYYSSPGTGTRVAMIDLNLVVPSKEVFFCFVWSPNEIRLSIGPKNVDGLKLITSEGKKSQKKFQIGEDGEVVQLGDDGVEVMYTRVNIEGNQIIKPTAIDAWNETKKAIEILQKGKSEEGFIFEVVKVNLCIVMLVTGFEAYCKSRYKEIDGEGICPNNKLVKQKLDKSKENFQDFDGYCKNIFKFGYNIKFSELINPAEFVKLKRLFKFRSRIVHASPMITMINEFEIPKEEPIFSTNIINETIALFNMFINKLHDATLKLREENW